MHLDQRCSSAISPELKKIRVLSIDPLLNCRHDFFVRPEMTSTGILTQVREQEEVNTFKQHKSNKKKPRRYRMA